jgi:tetratricopeptide (TPR) repeat protein
MINHWWISGYCRAERGQVIAGLNLPAYLATVDAHRRLRGPYTAVGMLLRLIGADALQRRPDLGSRHYIEIQESTPELIGSVPAISKRLESAAAPSEESTRYPARLHTLRIAHGLAEFVRDYLAALDDGPRTLVVENVHEADPTDQEFLAVLLRRLSPEQLTVVVCTRADVFTDPPGPNAVALSSALARYAVHRGGRAEPPPAAGIDDAEVVSLARSYVDSDCISDDPRERAGYERLGPAHRAALHDERSAQLISMRQPSLRLGAIPFHLEHGGDPGGAGVTALRWAQTHCKNLGFYHATAEFGARGLKLVDRVSQPEAWWKLTVFMAIGLAAAGRADEARLVHDQTRQLSADPVVHMKLAYETAMLYARHYDSDKRDTHLAREWSNQAIAIASLLPDQKERAFYSVFFGNGLALVEVREGRIDTALSLLDDGIARLERELPPEERVIHRTGLRYNRAQANNMCGRLEAALADYDIAMEIDDDLADHYFNRGGILRRLGRIREAIADYQNVLRFEPPFPEVYYNLGDAWLELGDADTALAHFGRALELDPDYAAARLGRATVLAGRDDDAAMADVRAGLDAEPGNCYLLCLKGQLLARHGSMTAARETVSEAVRSDPGLAEGWAIMGQLAYESADLATAISALDRAIALRDSPEIRYNRAVVHRAANRLVAAVEDLDAVLAVADDADARLLRDACMEAMRDGITEAAS